MSQNLNFYPNNGNGTFCYDNEVGNCSQFGALYKWTTAMGIDSVFSDSTYDKNLRRYNSDLIKNFSDHQGICPEGWLLPSFADFNVLSRKIITDFKLEDPSDLDEWAEFYTYEELNEKLVEGKENPYLFNANYSGYYYYNEYDLSPKKFRDLTGRFAMVAYHTIDEFSDDETISWELTEFNSYFKPDISSFEGFKNYGFSIRCFQNI
jgi:uncharacterized protein (TIGR02145 family)